MARDQVSAICVDNNLIAMMYLFWHDVCSMAVQADSDLLVRFISGGKQ